MTTLSSSGSRAPASSEAGSEEAEEGEPGSIISLGQYRRSRSTLGVALSTRGRTGRRGREVVGTSELQLCRVLA
eukprot:1475076-Rhodomonas_salina.3